MGDYNRDNIILDHGNLLGCGQCDDGKHDGEWSR